MQFNTITRGHKRERNTEEDAYKVLDAGFLCHVAFQHEGRTMMIPIAYGRIEDCLYLHGSNKNFMLNQVLTNESICISVTHVDGIVLAKTLFDTSMNYRSVVLFGRATLVTDEEERIQGLKTIVDNIIPGRWDEVSIGDDNLLAATMVIRFKIESASVKIRSGGPQGDENIEDKVWSGHIPLRLQALEPVLDTKFGDAPEQSPSVKNYYDEHS